MVYGELIGVSLETLQACYTCFKCVGICPAGLKPNLFVKAYIGSLFRELRNTYEEIIASSILWSCAKCLKCAEVCPQKVPLNDVIEYLQREAAKRGLAPRVYLDMIENIMTGFLAFGSQTIVSRNGEFYTTEEVRELLGLVSLPEPQNIERFREKLKGLRDNG